VVIHILVFDPALDTVGKSSTSILIVLVVGGHTPFDILHSKTFIPNPNPVIVELGLVGLVIIPLPLISDQVPIPIAGEFPANVVEFVEIQRV
jgi:hypothetical protein